MTNYTPKQLKEIFNSLESTIYSESEISESKLDKVFNNFKNIKKKPRDDEEYFKMLVSVTFYSGFKAKTVDDKMEDIQKTFDDYKKVAKFSVDKINKILTNSKIIRHPDKVPALVFNANKIIEIVKEFGSFNAYLDSFGNLENDDELFNAVKDLKKRFKYLGDITVFHFLTDLGVNVVKPDRVLCRIFYRLGLIDSEKDTFGVIKIGRKIAKATGYPIRYIDIAFVVYGQVGEKKEYGLANGICLEKNPSCEKCGLYKFCSYNQKKKFK